MSVIVLGDIVSCRRRRETARLFRPVELRRRDANAEGVLLGTGTASAVSPSIAKYVSREDNERLVVGSEVAVPPELGLEHRAEAVRECLDLVVARLELKEGPN